MRVFSFDVNQGSCGDLLRLGVLRRILRLLASGQCRGIFAAPPCTTYSCARKPALRSWLRPRGVDGLVGEERRRVLEANRLIDHLVIILDRASLLEVPGWWRTPNPAFCGVSVLSGACDVIRKRRWSTHICAVSGLPGGSLLRFFAAAWLRQRDFEKHAA